MISFLQAVNALIVNKPRDGGVSIMIWSNFFLFAQEHASIVRCGYPLLDYAQDQYRISGYEMAQEISFSFEFPG